MISVAMATCQGERWIGKQLQSILDQLEAHDEIVVADAQSTDRTLEIVRDLCGDKARLFTGIRRGDVPATFEVALSACKGNFIFLSDQDDVWLPGKVDECCDALSGTKPLVLHDARILGPDQQILSESFFRSRTIETGFWHNLWRPGFLGCAMACKPELLSKALPFPASLPMHDWWLGLLAERTGGVARISKPLIHHLRHGSNANFDPNASPYSYVRRISFRWRMWREVHQRLREAT